jgi:hypothetical protein
MEDIFLVSLLGGMGLSLHSIACLGMRARDRSIAFAFDIA